ncbi:MAG: Zn-dependent membrane protease YugP, partial [Myxococcota bacterium]
MQAMWEWVFDAVVPWAPAALLVTAPWLTALLALAIQRVAQRHLESRGPTLPVEAGPWAVVAAARHGVRVPVERHPGGVDAYWPSPGAIGLSVATWHGRSAVRYAIAAHELGHAWNATLHPALPDLLPVARLVQTHAWRAAVAGGLVGGLLALPFVLDLAWYAGFVALAASLAVLTDELSASRRGISALAGDPLVPREAVTIAQAAMCTAGTVYAAIAVGQFGVLAAWPQAAPYVLTLGSPAPPTVPAVWLLVLTLPL